MDGSGNVYVGGRSNSTWGSPVRPYTSAYEDAFAAKLAGAGICWQNQRNQFDVDGDGDVIPLDVLILINYINAHPSGALPDSPQLPPPYYDINNDGFCTPLDVLLVINYINSHPIGSGEGEAFPFFAPVFGIERPAPIVPRVPNGHTSVDDDPAEFLWASSHAADEGADRTQRANTNAVWDEGIVDGFDAVLVELDGLLPSIMGGLV